MLPWRARRQPDPKAITDLHQALSEENAFRAEIGIDPIDPRNVGLLPSLNTAAPASGRWLSRGRQGRGRSLSIAVAGLVGLVAAAAVIAATPEKDRPDAASSPDPSAQSPLPVPGIDDHPGEVDVDPQDPNRRILIRDPAADESPDGGGAPAEVTLEDLAKLPAGTEMNLGSCHVKITATDVQTTGCVLEMIPDRATSAT